MLTSSFKGIVVALYGIDLVANIVRIIAFAVAAFAWDRWNVTRFMVLVGWLSQFLILSVGLIPISRITVIDRESVVTELGANMGDPAVQRAVEAYELQLQAQVLGTLTSIILLRTLPVFVTILPSIANAAAKFKTLRPGVRPIGLVIQVAACAQGLLFATFGIVAIQFTGGNGWIYSVRQRGRG